MRGGVGFSDFLRVTGEKKILNDSRNGKITEKIVVLFYKNLLTVNRLQCII